MSGVLVFADSGDFAASRAAEAWCEARGISVGRCERGKPRGLLCGDYDIAEWHNLSARDIAELDGRMIGDMRNGPVSIDIKERAP